MREFKRCLSVSGEENVHPQKLLERKDSGRNVEVVSTTILWDPSAELDHYCQEEVYLPTYFTESYTFDGRSSWAEKVKGPVPLGPVRN